MVNIDTIRESVNYIEMQINESKDIRKPEIAVILGSGLGNLADEIANPLIIKYEDVPNFPKSTVSGHKGQFVIGNFKGKNVIMMQGRFHFYEGIEMREILKAVYTMIMLGAKTLLVTNAAGGVNEGFKPGTLMLIKDHINFSFSNPLIGNNISEFGPRFPDMTKAYTPKLFDVARKAAKDNNIDLKEGIYLMCSGPTYETPAEIRAFRLLGADAVGMSTVPEVIAASHAKMNVLGISCITNLAAGITGSSLNHEEVLEVSKKVNSQFIALLSSIIENI